MLEDESGRIRLVGERVREARLVTGIIIGALGAETANGDFEVIDICYPGMAPQPAREDTMDVDGKRLYTGCCVFSFSRTGQGSSGDEWIAVVSGLDIGSPSPSDAQIQMLVEYLTGEEGGVVDQVSAAQISRLIIAGNSLATLVPTGKGESGDAEQQKKPVRSAYLSINKPSPICLYK